MSLLLDALKKAAEQKAEKDEKQSLEGAVSAKTPHDETRIELGADDAPTDHQHRVAQISADETKLEREPTETSIARSDDYRGTGEETRMDFGDKTDTELGSVDRTSADYARGVDQTSADETKLEREPTETSIARSADYRGTGEETRMDFGDKTDTELGSVDRTSADYARGVDQTSADETKLEREPTETSIARSDEYRGTGEETRMDFGDKTDTELGSDRTSADYQRRVDQADSDDTKLGSDETQIRGTIFNSDEYTDLGEETIEKIFDEDQTLVLTDSDVTKFLGEEEPLPGETHKQTSDEDLSLILRDQQNTAGLLDDEPKADSLSAQTKVQILADSEATTNQLNLLGAPNQDRTDDQDHAAALTSDSTAVTDVNLDGLSGPQGMDLEDQTSTRTYAPDNYDRTLARVANDDATGLFAGMKSDAGLVMTPQHAKMVFLSKNSAQRLYHFKIFGGVAIGVLLVIFILGMFQFQQEALNIDANLRPLKRDPMPGVIQVATDKAPSINLLVEADQHKVDTQTLQLVEDAEGPGNTEIAVPEELEIAQISEPDSTPAQSTEAEIIESTQQFSQPVVANAGPVKKVSIETSASKLSEKPEKQLQISTSSTIRNKDRWLREAYAAYQRGDDKTALAKYNQVLEVDPGNRNALLARAAINTQDNKVAAAIRDYQTLLLANPKDSLATASLMAVATYSPETAESQLKIMIRDEPESPYLNFALANVYGAQDRWIEAQGLYFTALENNPHDPNYAYNLAVSLEHIEKPQVAIAYYQRALDNFGNGLAIFDRNVVDQRLEKLKQL